jgi:hypothetical protein
MKNRLMSGVWRHILSVPPLPVGETGLVEPEEYRSKTHRIRGVYFTSEQIVSVTRIIQSAWFGSSYPQATELR